MKKKHPIVMLPTEKTGTIQRNKSDKLWISKVSTGKSSTILERPVVIGGTYDSAQHLYILSDEEIKEGDYFYSTSLREKEIIQCREICFLTFGMVRPKVIATTDKSLTKLFGAKADYDVIELPQIPESFLPIFLEAYNSGNPMTEVELEYDNISIFPEAKGNVILPKEVKLKTTELNEVIISLPEPSKEDLKKYYTPDISEFHVGFEYDYNGKCVFKRDMSISFMDYLISNSNIRVKYLDKEDIESLGFELDANSPLNIPVFRKGNIAIVIIDGDYTKLLISNSDNGSVLFNGMAMNKSELKKILKQIGV
jgi:hypothetical protein